MQGTMFCWRVVKKSDYWSLARLFGRSFRKDVTGEMK